MHKRSLIFAIVLLSFYAAHAWGADFLVVPSFSGKEDYNDNILMSPYDIRRDFITTLSPGLDVIDRDERLEADLLAHMDRLEYADNSALDASSYLYRGTVNYQIDPRLTFSTQAAYTKSANPTLTPASTGILTISGALYHVSAVATASYQFTEKAAGTLSYNYGKDYYDNPLYLPDISHNVNAGYVYDLGEYVPRLKGRVNAGYSYYYYPDSEIDNVLATIGFSWDIDETWSIQADAGARRTWSNVIAQQLVPSSTIVIDGNPIPIAFQVAGVAVSKAGWGAIGDVSLNYKGERTNGALTYTRSLTPVSGLNGAAESDAASISVQRRLTEELTASLSLGYYMLRSDASQFSASVSKENSSDIGISLHYVFSRDTFMDASYDNSQVEYPVSSTTARRQDFSLRLSTQYPLLE